MAPLSATRYKLQVTLSAETHAKLRTAQDLLRHAVPSGDVAEVLDRALTLLVEQLGRRKAGICKRTRAGGSAAEGRRSASGCMREGGLPSRCEDEADSAGRPAPGTRAGASSGGKAPADLPLPAPATLRVKDGRDRAGDGRASPAPDSPASPGERRPDEDAPVAGPIPASRYIPADVRRQVWTRDGAQCTYVAPNGRRCQARSFLEFHHRLAFANGGGATVENVQVRCRRHHAPFKRGRGGG